MSTRPDNTPPGCKSIQCYACVDPNSATLPRRYFTHPDAVNISMHATCFLEFAAELETQTNLEHLLRAWSGFCRFSRRHRIEKVLFLVHDWWWEHKAKSHDYSRILTWTFARWLRNVVPPPLVDSSSDVPPPLVDSSSDD